MHDGLHQNDDDDDKMILTSNTLTKQEAQLLLGDRATRKHAKDS